MIIDDANVVLKSYDDNKSDSGNIAKVSLEQLTRAGS